MVQNEKKQNKINTIIKTKAKLIIFIAINVLLVIQLILIGIITFSKDNGFKFYGTAYIKGIPYEQEVNENNELRVGVIKIKTFYDRDLKVDNFIIVSSSKDENYLWSAKITSINASNKTIVVSIIEWYEEEAISLSDIHGSYAGESGIFGKMIYGLSKIEGFLFLAAISGIISVSLYFVLLKKNKIENSI